MSVNTCNIASFAVPVRVTYARARMRPPTPSKLGACSLKPFVFLDALSDIEKKGQKFIPPSSVGEKKKKGILKLKRETDKWDRRVETARQV